MRFGKRVELEFDCAGSGEHIMAVKARWIGVWDQMSQIYRDGPTKTAAEALDEDRREQLHQTWVDFFDSHYRSDSGVSTHAGAPPRRRHAALNGPVGTVSGSGVDQPVAHRQQRCLRAVGHSELAQDGADVRLHRFL